MYKGHMWKCRMINTKLQVKQAFGLKSNYKLSEEDCIKRVKYIQNKMIKDGYEPKCCIDLIYYIRDKLNGLHFDNADYIAQNEVVAN